MITVSVPGKIILMGEHAVVYGKPAFIAVINKRLTATIRSASALSIIAPEGKEYIAHIINCCLSYLKKRVKPKIRLTITSDIPIGYHLGSSAAVAAGIIGALLRYYHHPWDKTLINELTFQAEQFMHIHSSGVDPASVVNGGFLWYRKELDFLRCITPLSVVSSQLLTNFYLMNTGKPKESTGEMVAYIGAKYKSQKTKYLKLFEENEVQTKRIACALKDSDEQILIDALKQGEQTLEAMGVVSKQVLPIIRHVEQTGGAVKILGGGGRTGGVGYLLCYSRHPPKGSEPIHLGGEGIRLE